MGYSTNSPPRMAIPGVGAAVPSVWLYDSADAATVVRAADYFTDALDLGMKKGDIIIQSDSAGATVAHIYPVLTVDEDGADLGDGTAIVVTNS